MSQAFYVALHAYLMEQRRHLIAQVKAIEVMLEFLDQESGAVKTAGKGYNYADADANIAAQST